MRNLFKRKPGKLWALLILIVLAAVSLVGGAYSKYRTQVAVSGKISYRTQLANGFTLQTEGETKCSAGGDSSFVPGTTLYRDPCISITGKTQVKSVLYVEVILPDGVSCCMNECWTPLHCTGPGNGQVYVYENGRILDDTTEPDLSVKLFADGAIRLDTTPAEDEVSLEAVGYLIQINETYTGDDPDSAAALFAARLG